MNKRPMEKLAALGMGILLSLSAYPAFAGDNEDRPASRIVILYSGEAHGQIHPHG